MNTGWTTGPNSESMADRVVSRPNVGGICIRTDGVYDGTHLVELFGAYIWAVGEAKVDQAPFPQKITVGKGGALVRDQREWASDFCSTIAGCCKFLL